MKSGELKIWPPTEKNVLLYNPKFSAVAVQRYQETFDRYISQAGGTDAIGLLTSGTTATHADDFKIIVLTRDAFETSAQAVNRWIHAKVTDRWSLSLPRFHVGGVSILARAALTQSEVISYGDMKWDPQAFHQHLSREKITLVSLVPTQIYDLVRFKLSSPTHLRCVFVGGGELRADLWARARELGWPLILTFGMTEMCSQVACSRMGSSGNGATNLYLLPHISARLDSNKKLLLRSRAQLTAKIELTANQLKIHEYNENDWFSTEDFAELQIIGPDTRLIPLGRGADFVKIKGENVSLKKLRDLWSRLLANEELNENCYLFAKPETRDGHSIYVAASLGYLSTLEEAQRKYNEHVLPFERIQRIVEIPEIPRNDLGKVLVSKILELIK